MKRLILCGLVLVALASYVATVVMPWSPLNSLVTAVDLNSGRLRHSRHLAYLKVYETVEETPLSKALRPRTGVPDWHTTGTVSPPFVNYSPSYVYGEALPQIRDLEFIWKFYHVNTIIRMKTAQQVLGLWQSGGSTSTARQFLFRLESLCREGRRDQLISRLEDNELSRDEGQGPVITRTFFYPDGSPLLRVQGFFDPNGRLVRHGTFEAWHPSSKKEL
jgi:hypothetical protein